MPTEPSGVYFCSPPSARVCVFRCALTSSWARPAALAFSSGGRVQQAHVGHLDSGSGLCDQLPGSLSQLPPPLGVSLLQQQIRVRENFSVGIHDNVQRHLKSYIQSSHTVLILHLRVFQGLSSPESLEFMEAIFDILIMGNYLINKNLQDLQKVRH